MDDLGVSAAASKVANGGKYVGGIIVSNASNAKTKINDKINVINLDNF